MEENPPNQSKSISIPNLLQKSLSSLSSSSLFSTIITLYALILLYFPSLFFDIIFSPVFISTGVLLLFLLRLGAIQRTEYISDAAEINTKEKPTKATASSDSHFTQTPHESSNPVHRNKQQEEKVDESSLGKVHKPYYSDSFREWNVRAPLEVIYEEYGEGQDDDDDYNNDEEEDNDRNVFNEKIERRVLGIDEKYPTSLSKYYPESDSDSSSEDGDFAMIGNWESSEGEFFKWNEEDREELIEIALDGKRRNCAGDDDCHFGEEDNLIEIDIFPARN